MLIAFSHCFVLTLLSLESVQIRDPFTGDRMQDFVIAHAIHCPHTSAQGNLPNIEV